MPMGFLSPGLGPFSPALNSPQQFVFNPFMNAAPGAPLNMTPTAQHPTYMMTPGAPLTVDPTSRHHPANPDYFPPMSPISHAHPPLAEPEQGSTTPKLAKRQEADVVEDFAQLGLADTAGQPTGFNSRASFVSTRPELSVGLLVDRDRRASMNDAAQ